MSRRWVSLGGWCGPALILAKLGMCAPQETPGLPFDAVRCSLDGLVHFVANGFGSDFFPPGPPPYKPDPASIWLLFRGQHTCFTHHDLNRKEIQASFRQRFANWDSMVEQPTKPVVFLRTSIAENPFMEAGLLSMLEEALDTQSKKQLDFRTVLMVHDQGKKTEKIAEPTPRSCVWNIALDTTVPTTASLFDKTEKGYREVIADVSSDAEWLRAPSTRQLSPAPVDCARLYTTLSTVEGVPALGGTCKGIGSTASVAVGRCVFCGSTNNHAVDRSAFDTGKPWSSDDDTALAVAYTVHGDIVAACEDVACQQGRSANEVLIRAVTLGLVE